MDPGATRRIDVETGTGDDDLKLRDPTSTRGRLDLGSGANTLSAVACTARIAGRRGTDVVSVAHSSEDKRFRCTAATGNPRPLPSVRRAGSTLLGHRWSRVRHTVAYVIAAWCGFVGAWVLVAGPMYQGAVELNEVDIDRPEIMAQASAVPQPERVSPWWWLLPPVAYLKIRRHQGVWRQQVMAALTPRQREDFVAYSHKAAGWFVVGAGAALIGIKEAIELVEALEWPGPTTIPLVVVAAALALTFTFRRIHLSQRALHAGE